MSFLSTLFGRRRDPRPTLGARDEPEASGLTKYSRFESTAPRAVPDPEPAPSSPFPEPGSSSAPVLLHPATGRRPAPVDDGGTFDWTEQDDPPPFQFVRSGAEGPTAVETPEPAPAPETTPAPEAPPAARPRRSRTRLIGFESARKAPAEDPFASADKQVESGPQVQFPVGWLVVRRGPGRGHAFVLTAGMAQIGRGEGQAIQLDFGDTAISRDNHAAIVYDPNSRGFLLGHGGKANIVRLNGKPVLTNETLSDGDEITIGETTLLLKALCGPGFSWDESGEERDDVAPA